MFTWWCLIDQRLSMWTPLVGPMVALFFVLGKSAIFLYTYALWVGFTRLMQALSLLSVRPTISGLYPVLIYFGQVYGALVKTYILFRLDRQRWTRQNIVAPGLSGARDAYSPPDRSLSAWSRSRRAGDRGSARHQYPEHAPFRRIGRTVLRKS